ncbi:hypothetical protein [Maioricimonas rarisocia]|nr:hypothetical protein [Maioricimonas rarisocia]
MSGIDWQTGVALLCVVFSAAVLLRRAVQLFWGGSTAGCGAGGCSDCPASGTPEQPSKTLVSLEPLQSPRPIS